MFKFLFNDHREVEILRSVDPNAPRPAGLTIRLAESKEDYVAAGRLLYHSYQRRRIAFKHESEIRVIPQLMTPTASVVIALSGEQIIATATVVCNNPLSFPIGDILTAPERHEHFVEKNGPVCEIASLAFDDDFLAPKSGLFNLLAGYLHEYCVNLLGAKKILIGTHPGVVEFYRTMFGFEPINGVQGRPYPSAGGDPTVPLWVTSLKFSEKLLSISKKFPRLKSLAQVFLTNPKIDAAYIYPVIENRGHFCPKNVELLEELFLKQTNMMKEIDPARRAKVEALYPVDDDYKWVFHLDAHVSRRRVRRFAVSLATTIAVRSIGNGITTHEGMILDISENGAQVRLGENQEPLPGSGEVTLTISISDTTETSVHGEVIRRDPDLRSYGIQITDCSSTFLAFLRTLSNQKAS